MEVGQIVRLFLCTLLKILGMGRIAFAWFTSVCIGSLLMPLFLGAEISIPLSFFCAIVSAAFTIPLIIIELIVWGYYRTKRFELAWMQYSLYKYIVAGLTVMAVSFMYDPKMAGIVVVFYGIPGLLLHGFYLKPRLKSQCLSGRHETFMEED
jgi:hypothetical protein